MEDEELAFVPNENPDLELVGAQLLAASGASDVVAHAADSVQNLYDQDHQQEAELAHEIKQRKRRKGSSDGSKSQRWSSQSQNKQTSGIAGRRPPKRVMSAVMEEAQTKIDGAKVENMKLKYAIQAASNTEAYARELANVLQQAMAQASLRDERRVQQPPKVEEMRASMVNAINKGRWLGLDWWDSFIALPQHLLSCFDRDSLQLVCNLIKTWKADSPVPERRHIERSVASAVRIRLQGIQALAKARTDVYGSLIELASHPSTRECYCLPKNNPEVLPADPYARFLETAEITLEQKRCMYPSWYKYQKRIALLNIQIKAANAFLVNGIRDEQLNTIEDGTRLGARAQMFCSMAEATQFLNTLKAQVLQLYTMLVMGVCREMTAIQHGKMIAEFYPFSTDCVQLCSLLFAEQSPGGGAAALSLPLTPLQLSSTHDSN